MQHERVTGSVRVSARQVGALCEATLTQMEIDRGDQRRKRDASGRGVVGLEAVAV